MAELIIGGLIAVWAGYVIYKKVKDMKKGKFCSCGCESCTGCKKYSEKEKF